MEIKPTKGVKVRVETQREAIFGDEAVDIRTIKLPPGGSRVGILTGVTLAGYCEVEMPSLDGRKHWYPIDGLSGERGEKLVEDEIQIAEDGEDDAED